MIDGVEIPRPSIRVDRSISMEIGQWMEIAIEGLMRLNNIRGKFVYYLLVIDLMNILRMEKERYF